MNLKQKITLVPQFVGDKHVIQDERTINNLVIVEVKPEFQIAFKNSVLPEMATSLDVEHGVLAMYAASNDERIKKESYRKAIPEFRQFNIVENEVRNVI